MNKIEEYLKNEYISIYKLYCMRATQSYYYVLTMANEGFFVTRYFYDREKIFYIDEKRVDSWAKHIKYIISRHTSWNYECKTYDMPEDKRDIYLLDKLSNG